MEDSPAMRRIFEEQGWSLEALPRGAVIAVARLEWAEPTTSVYLPDMLDRLGGACERELGDLPKRLRTSNSMLERGLHGERIQDR